jgi:hypothetical protein
VERAGYGIGALLLVGGLVHLAILIASGGSWEGPLSWRKPATFGLSFGLTLITIVWVASFLRLEDRARAILLGSFTVACVVETALVTMQTWRGVPSHYNFEKVLDGAIARALAVGGFTLVAVIVALTVVAFRANAQLRASLRSAIRIGFVALLGAAAAGALMIAKGMVLVFAGDEQTASASGTRLKAAGWQADSTRGSRRQPRGVIRAGEVAHRRTTDYTRRPPAWTRSASWALTSSSCMRPEMARIPTS